MRRYRLAWTYRDIADPDSLRRDYQDCGGRDYVVVGPGRRIEISPLWLTTEFYAQKIAAALGLSPDDPAFRAFLSRLMEDAEEARLLRHEAA